MEGGGGGGGGETWEKCVCLWRAVALWALSFCFFLWRGSNVNRFFSFSFSFFWDVGTPRSWARAAPCFRGWMFLHRWILLLFVCGLDNWWDFPFIISFYFFLLPLSSYSKLKLSNFLASEKKFLVELRKGFFFFFLFFSFLVLPQGLCTCTYIIDYFCVFLGRLYIIFASGEKDMIFYWTNHWGFCARSGNTTMVTYRWN